MVRAFHVPSAPLSETVSLMVYHREYVPGHTMERFLPDGGIEMVVDLEDEPEFILDERTGLPLHTYRRAWVSGIRTRPITISVGNGSPMLVIMFRPHAASAVFRVPMDELRDRVVPAETVLGCAVDLLRERLAVCREPADIFETAEAWLGRCIGSSGRGVRVASHAATLLAARPAMATIDDVVCEMGISHRTLVTAFREHIGVTPKQFQRVHRFQEVVRRVDCGLSVQWSSVALECGFYDQAHMANEFRRFSGFTPTEYLATRGEILNWVPIS